MNQTVRTYNKQPLIRGTVATCSVMTEEEKSEQAEAILLTLGMDKQDISDIPEDTLLSAVDCEQIINTISHTKCDADGNVTYLSDAEMSEVAATLAQKQEILDKRDSTLGAWDGRAGVIKLPKDADSQEIDITISDFRACFEFCAYVRTVTDEKYFGSVGTYAHTQMTLDYDPTLTIEPGRNVSFSVGVSTAKTEERRSAEMLLHYVPG